MSKVQNIMIAHLAGDPMISVESAELESGLGIVGDRYYKKQGTFSKVLAEKGDFEVTLIAAEEIVAFNESTGLDYNADHFRRNIVTEGVGLPTLIGKEFILGGVTLRAIRLCEPCKHLAGILGEVILQKMMGKCGIRAIIVKDGSIAIGDKLSVGITS